MREPTAPVRRPAGDGPAGRHGGSLSLEYGLALPVVFLLVWVLFSAAVVGRDALLVQHAARHAARVAATTTDDAAVRAAASEAMDGRAAAVSVAPPGRRPGTVVTVTVSYRSRAGAVGVELTGRAAATVEPGVGGPGPSLPAVPPAGAPR